jgi:hypothetical protein
VASNARITEAKRLTDEATEVARRNKEHVAEMSRRMDGMQARLERGQEQIRRDQEAQAALNAARQERDSSEWIFKASTTSDSTLRAA